MHGIIFLVQLNWLTPLKRGCGLLTTFEALMLTFTFASLIVAMLSFDKKK
ncbi:putative holin-like toxin [Bacillus swezeyi]